MSSDGVNGARLDFHMVTRSARLLRLLKLLRLRLATSRSSGGVSGDLLDFLMGAQDVRLSALRSPLALRGTRRVVACGRGQVREVSRASDTVDL